MTTAAAERRGPGRSLGAKMALLLSAAGAAFVLLSVLYLTPAVTARFAAGTEAVIARGATAMRAAARDDAATSREVLQSLIESGAGARERALADLPLRLYRGDVERIRAAIRVEDVERDGRLLRNVDVLARERERRGMRAAEAHVAAIRTEQAEIGDRFGRALRREHLWLGGATFALLLLMLGVGLWRGVVRPVRELAGAARAVARGDLDVVVRTGAGDEIGELAVAFASMVRDLRTSRQEIARQNAELQTFNDKLGAEVERKTRHLAQALDDLQRAQRQLVHAAKMASLGTLAGGVAHEFNNLVGGIRGCAIEALADEADPERRETLEVIRRAADRAAAVTDQLLRFARPRVGRRAAIDLSAVIAEVIRLCQPRCRELGIEVGADLPGGLTVEVDGDALHQVFLNLLTNAIDAMPGGGRLRVSAAVAGRDLEVRVADSGPGVPPDLVDRIFEPFFSSKDPGAGGRTGVGLGLSVSHGIVEAHGGMIGVESPPGGGAVFTVRLPAGGGGAA